MSTTFPDPEWRHAAVRLLAVLNGEFQHADYLRPKAELQENDLAAIGAALASYTYRPAEWFEAGPAVSSAALPGESPRIDAGSEYSVLKLNALRETVSRRSLRFGGVAFEDPFYALLACFNVGVHGKLLLLPKVTSVAEAWRRRTAILDALSKRTYDPSHLFQECAPAAGNRTGLPLAALSVRGDLLQQIRQVGRGNIQDGAGFAQYALYEFIPEQ